MNKPEGIIEIRDGKLFIQSAGAMLTGVYMALPKPVSFSVTPGEKIQMTVTAQGIGKFGYWAYKADGKFFGKACTGHRVSKDEMEKYSAVFTVAEDVVKIIPFILADKKDGSITIESVQVERLR